MATKTLVIRVEVDGPTEAILQAQAKASARWMNGVFRLLYADKRNRKWAEFGPTKEWGKTYGCVVSQVDGRWKVRGEALYPAFIRKDAPYRQECALNNMVQLQLLSQRVATTWSNFLNGDIPRPKGRLPTFHPVAMFHVEPHHFTLAGDRLHIRLSKGVEVASVRSKDLQYIQRLEAVCAKPGWSAVEVKQREDGTWYVHIPVPVDAPRVPRKIKGLPVMGVDVGIRNTMTVAVVRQEGEVPPLAMAPVSGRSTFHRLELVHRRVRGLSSRRGRGKKSAQRVLERLKGKRRRIQETMAWMAAHDLAEYAEREGVKGIAVENLRGGFKPTLSKRMNRLVTNWQRGRARDMLKQKAGERGIAVHEVPARGTSSTCPVCSPTGYAKPDKKARDRKTHTFKCKKCGFIGNDDFVGAINIAHRGWRYWYSPKWDSDLTVTPAMQVVCGDTPPGDTHLADSGPLPAAKPIDAQGPATGNGALTPAGDETPVAESPRTGRLDGGARVLPNPHLSGEARLDPTHRRTHSDIDQPPYIPEPASAEVIIIAPGGARPDDERPDQPPTGRPQRLQQWGVLENTGSPPTEG